MLFFLFRTILLLSLIFIFLLAAILLALAVICQKFLFVLFESHLEQRPLLVDDLLPVVFVVHVVLSHQLQYHLV